MNEKTTTILPEILPDDPMHLAESWFNYASAQKLQPNPNAMALVTVSEGNQPSARVVLCKLFVPEPGYIVFFTNYRSRKSHEIMNNSNVSAVFHWDHIGRQIRIEGKAILSPPQESDAYFKTRGIGSQLSAWGSDQSQPLESREHLITQIEKRAVELGLKMDSKKINTVCSSSLKEIPRPTHWGGIQIWVTKIELWMDGEHRVHDRAVWTRTLKPSDSNSFSSTKWAGQRLQP